MHNRTAMIAALVVGLGLAGALHLGYSRLLQAGLTPGTEMATTLVDGIYRSESCGEIRLDKGRVWVGAESVPFAFFDIKGQPTIIPQGAIRFARTAGGCRLSLSEGERYQWPYESQSIWVLDDPTNSLVAFSRK